VSGWYPITGSGSIEGSILLAKLSNAAAKGGLIKNIVRIRPQAGSGYLRFHSTHLD
jgi:hypothetical protein